MFKRNVTFAQGRSKQLYNLMFNGISYTDMVLPFDGYKTSNDTLEIIIHNKDDKPIDINGVLATYFAQDIIFEGNSDSTYSLLFGNNEITIPPSYDISNYKDMIIKEGYDLLKISDIKQEDTKQEPEQGDYTMIFNIVVTIIALLLGVVIILKLKKNKTIQG